MTHKIFTVICLLLMSMAVEAKKIKVACVGNSITYGYVVANREKNCYPAQLERYLGINEYEVGNFGVSGTTLLKKGDRPYWKTEAYKQSLAFEPDIVLIKLGTNDSKGPNRPFISEYKEDYRSLIKSYQKLSSRPRIILLTPTRNYLSGNGIDDQLLQREFVPQIMELAYEEQLEVIDMYRIFGEHLDLAILTDHLHPSSIGANLIAKHIYKYLSQRRVQVEPVIVDGAERFNFYGYEGINFQLNNVACKLVAPRVVAKGKPWVLRARFWGHEPQIDRQLLERGFHIAYCDVANLYGNKEAIKRWDRLYRWMLKHDFNKKVVLEGMSRGGLIVYNWAVKNPKSVACIYADAPVLDVKSWPMGEVAGKRSEHDVELLLKAYSKKDEEELKQMKVSPIDHIRSIVKSRIPLLHVVGDKDEVVPMITNTNRFENEINRLGGKIQVIHKPEVGHHPHALFDPTPIVDFILRSTNMYENLCSRAACGFEFRSGAGWKNGADWHMIAEEISEVVTKHNDLDLLLLGNSITQGLGGNRSLVTYKPGEEFADQCFTGMTWESAGISGDRVENLLWRVEHGGYEKSNPKHVLITIGVNNLNSGKDHPDDVVSGIEKLVNICEQRFPQAEIVLLGMLPAGLSSQSSLRIKCEEVHRQLERKDWRKTTYFNPTKTFTKKNGQLKRELYSEDFIHLSAEGYRHWCSLIKELID